MARHRLALGAAAQTPATPLGWRRCALEHAALQPRPCLGALPSRAAAHSLLMAGMESATAMLRGLGAAVGGPSGPASTATSASAQDLQAIQQKAGAAGRVLRGTSGVRGEAAELAAGRRRRAAATLGAAQSPRLPAMCRCALVTSPRWRRCAQNGDCAQRKSTLATAAPRAAHGRRRAPASPAAAAPLQTLAALYYVVSFGFGLYAWILCAWLCAKLPLLFGPVLAT